MSEQNLQAVSIYDRIAGDYAAAYDNLDDESDLVFLNTYIKYMQPGEKVLDLGCGTGFACGYFAKHGLRPFGIDLSKNMIAIARKNFPELEFRVENMLDFVPDGQFDAIYAGYSLHHFTQKEVEKVISNFSDYLKRGGMVGLVVQKGVGEFETDEPFLPGEKIFVYLFDEKNIAKLLSENGIEVVETKIKKPTKGEFPYDNLLIIGRKK